MSLNLPLPAHLLILNHLYWANWLQSSQQLAGNTGISLPANLMLQGCLQSPGSCHGLFPDPSWAPNVILDKQGAIEQSFVPKRLLAQHASGNEISRSRMLLLTLLFSLWNQTALPQKANKTITAPLLAGPGPDVISFSFVLSRGLLKQSLKVVGLIFELLPVLGMQVALVGAFATDVPPGVGLWVGLGLWVMGTEFTGLQKWN